MRRPKLDIPLCGSVTNCGLHYLSQKFGALEPKTHVLLKTTCRPTDLIAYILFGSDPDVCSVIIWYLFTSIQLSWAVLILFVIIYFIWALNWLCLKQTTEPEQKAWTAVLQLFTVSHCLLDIQSLCTIHFSSHVTLRPVWAAWIQFATHTENAITSRQSRKIEFAFNN